VKNEKKRRLAVYSQYRLVTLLFLLGLLLRCFFFYYFTQYDQRAWLCYDSEQYHQRALSIAKIGQLTEPDSTQKAYRVPGYPLLLAAGYACTDNNVHVVLWLQVVLAAFIPVLIFMLASALFPAHGKLALMAMFLASVHTGLVLFAGMLATETVAVLLFLVFLLSLCWFQQARQLRFLLLAACTLGALSLVRPIGHYVLILTLVWLWWQHVNVRQIGLFASTWGLCVAPWLVRNLLVVGGICFHTLPGIHFLQYTAASVVMQRDHCEYVPARSKLLALWEETAQKHGLTNEFGYCLCAEKIALQHIKNHPIYAAKHGATELFKTLCSLHSSQIILADVGTWPVYTTRTTWLEKIIYNLAPPLKTWWLRYVIYADVCMALFLLLGSLFGLFMVCLQRQLSAAIGLCVLAAGLLWSLTVAYGCARLRLPIEPIMIILASYGASYAFNWMVAKMR
jgi:hypothetical protein